MKLMSEMNLKAVLILCLTFCGFCQSNSEDVPDLRSKGVCGNIDIRFDIDRLKALEGCRKVHGNVMIFLIDDVNSTEIEAFSFPLLTEITGFLMMYRLTGIKSLAQLFPNLSVIRGDELFKGFALILYELIDLENLGLNNLKVIENGGVRIEKNSQLCFWHTIDWSSIVKADDEVISLENKLQSYCPLCPQGVKNCWNLHQPQVVCDCNGNSCDSTGKCCDPSCLTCSESGPKVCQVCKRLENFVDGTCVDTCPVGSLEYERLCLTSHECTNLQFIFFNGTCVSNCPISYKKQIIGGEKTCQKDIGLTRCTSEIIDSIEVARKLKGCQIIEGPLEIQIRMRSRNDKIVKEIESALSDIVEIRDYLKIARSFPLVSLNFLKNLKVIRGYRLESNKYSLVVWDNQNLQELFKDDQIDILNGKLFVHYNPKLCFFNVQNLVKSSMQIENYDFAQKSNGDKTQCNITELKVDIVNKLSHAVLLNWTPIRLDDERSLLSYVVYYTEAPEQNVDIWNERNVCGPDRWLVDDVNDFNANDTFIAYPITRIKAFTQYAFYVKAYTLATERKGAQSTVQYFTTLPAKPDKINNLTFEKSDSELAVTWNPPLELKGELDYYEIKIKEIARHLEGLLDNRDNCHSQNSNFFIDNDFIDNNNEGNPSTVKPSTVEPSTDELSTVERFVDEWGTDVHRQLAIDFEDQLQDFVYIRQEPYPQNHNERQKRQVLEFPDKNQDLSKKPQDPLADVESLKTNKTSFVFSNLKHFSQYIVSVKACRKPSLENRNQYGDKKEDLEDRCGEEVKALTMTLKKKDVDKVSKFTVEKSTDNNSVRFIWKTPQTPNGCVVNFLIKMKNHANNKTEILCISAKHQQKFYERIEVLSPGIWKFSIAAVSHAGQGSFTKTIELSL